MNRLDQFERWLDVMWKFHRLVIVFFAGMIFGVLMIIACYISTGGK